MTKKAPDCQSCHYFIRVDGRPACTHTRQRPGKPAYRFLKSLKLCEDFWRVH